MRRPRRENDVIFFEKPEEVDLKQIPGRLTNASQGKTGQHAESSGEEWIPIDSVTVRAKNKSEPLDP